MLLKIYFGFFVLRYLGVYASDCMEKPHCGVNEVWDCSCLPPLTCDDPCGTRDGPQVCPLGPDGNCVKKCVCRPGFVRGSSGRCTHCTQCTHLDEDDCCDDEEFQFCGTFCPETCASRGKTVTCTEQCVKGCFCKKGHVRDINGICVDPEECPPICGANETFSQNPVICPPQTCDAIGKAFTCPANTTGPPACICKKGYLRNEENKCVLKADCASNCPKGEVFKTCGPTCSPKQPSCDNRSPGCANTICSRGCYCPDGFMRKFDDGPCIKTEECPNSPCQGDENAEWITTPVPCAVTCQNKSPPKHCTTTFGCKCKKGLILNEMTKKCIDSHNCPVVCPKGEVFKTCGPTCRPKQPSCDNRSPSCINELCTRGCFCPDKYIRKFDDGPCIKIEQCPNSPCQGDENAEWITTPVPCAVTCQNKNPPKNCSTTFGCKCKKGLLLDEISKKCVKPNNCPIQCGPNQHLDSCPVDCPSDYCPTRDGPPVACSAPYPCPPPKCKCDFNFKKDKNGNCIPTRQCPPFECTGENEVFNPCPPLCPTENCADSDLNGVCPYPILIVLPCNPQCRCVRGFFRNENGVCIPASNCPDDSAG